MRCNVQLYTIITIAAHRTKLASFISKCIFPGMDQYFLKQSKSSLFDLEKLQRLLEPQSLSAYYLTIKNTSEITVARKCGIVCENI